jgi:hypothetical protein
MRLHRCVQPGRGEGRNRRRERSAGVSIDHRAIHRSTPVTNGPDVVPRGIDAVEHLSSGRGTDGDGPRAAVPVLDQALAGCGPYGPRVAASTHVHGLEYPSRQVGELHPRPTSSVESGGVGLIARLPHGNGVRGRDRVHTPEVGIRRRNRGHGTLLPSSPVPVDGQRSIGSIECGGNDAVGRSDRPDVGG